MADSTRSREWIEACKRNEMLLVDERARREAGEKNTNERFDEIALAQTGLQSAMVAMQQQLQNIADQMKQYNHGRSVLGEGPTAAHMERGSTSHSAPSRQTNTNSDGNGGGVLSLRPTSVLQAVSLAKRQESSVHAIVRRATTLTKNLLPPKPPFRTPQNFSHNPRIPPTPQKLPFKSNTENYNPPRRLLTAAEMKSRRDKNLVKIAMRFLSRGIDASTDRYTSL
ncbi:hypothetical protein BUALT_Bualt08G0136000 [Buddleja alternifolia]|uniref:Uncharacterized protein n=1 Tax=Buddleja alternifolia TaxID=168488 RepID=A0AAV6XA01_9LAMI|nr:hypothetical protein BUALT_Bualt08G0136000 [Buddleja alternifolia]